ARPRRGRRRGPGPGDRAVHRAPPRRPHPRRIRAGPGQRVPRRAAAGATARGTRGWTRRWTQMNTPMDRDILLVEDNPDDVELTRIAFAEADLDTRLEVVRDGAEALDYLFARGAWAGRDPARLPSIVLLDLNLP